MTSCDTNSEALPFLTADMDGMGGLIKTRPEDFIVEEIPVYEFSGAGDHVLAYLEKKGMPTLEALRRIAAALHLPRKQIGYAGLKDARAVTRQWISIEHLDPERLRGLNLDQIKILEITRHTNKLKLGHLAGNRFNIRIRQTDLPPAQAVCRAGDIGAVLTSRGAPNFFGPQRFGYRADGHQLGAAIINQRADEFIDLFLGAPSAVEQRAIIEARQFYDQGQFERAFDAWPPLYHDQRRALKALIKSGDKNRAFKVIDKTLKRLYISAFQSHLFNQVVAARLPHLDRLLAGDMAYKHDNGACFRVEDAAAEQPRCDAFEISPTGPLYGYRMTELTGPAGEIENALLAKTHLVREDFRRMDYYRVKGARRPLRFQPRQVKISSGADDAGEYLQLSFELDSGCYATTFVREITKTDNLT